MVINYLNGATSELINQNSSFKLETFSVGTIWMSGYSRGTSIVDVVGLHILF